MSSTALNHDAENPVIPELLAWADIVFVMERSRRRGLGLGDNLPMSSHSEGDVMPMPADLLFVPIPSRQQEGESAQRHVFTRHQ
jgi:hypothetical protein